VAALIRKPIVRLIAVTHFQKPDDLQEFQIWQTDTDNEPQQLIEAAGRTCYNSFSNPSGRTNEQYIANLLSQGHMCYDEETEVLTAAGWKKWNEIKESDLLATLNPLTYELEFQRPIALHAYCYSGKMYHVKSRLIDLLVTPNHRLFVCPMTTKVGRCRRTFKFLTAQQAYRLNCCYLRTAFHWEGEKVDFITVNGHRLPAEPFLAFLGFFLGDGSIHSPNTVDFHLRKARKIEFLHQVVQAMGMQLKKTADNHFRLTLEGLGVWLGERCYTSEGKKRIPPEFLWLERSLLEALLSGLLSSDGHYGERGDRNFSNTSKALIDQVQELCLKVGMAASVRPLSSMVEGAWVCHISNAVTPEVNRSASNWETHDEWVDYSGMVFCATVPNGIVYVRRDGYPVWCGNSVIEHSVASFYIRGVSRALTHEIVRHRHFSYSQRSTRYVDESDCNFIVPDCIADDPEALKIFEEAVLTCQEAYRRLCEVLERKFADVEDRTLRRKMVRQAARSVLPNATETALVMTGNFRAWRHFIRLRASRYADPEIRRLAIVILRELQRVAPAVFGDFQIIPLPDGTEEAVPKYIGE
jgi:thymidylate synthase (FAD)